ncbi:PilW family protein [Patescibacteria group bacterium]
MKKKKGFTLIEMLVAVSIFALVIGSITGLFVAAVRSQVKVLITQRMLDETSFSLEYMSRTLRMARKDLCDDPMGCCLKDGFGYNYSHANWGGEESVEFVNYREFPGEGTSCGVFYKSLSNEEIYILMGSTSRPLTSGDVNATSFKFDFSGEEQGNVLQPRVTALMTIENALISGPEIRIQTSVSQRNLDVYYNPP